MKTPKEYVGLFKVGLELFISQGPKIIDAIRCKIYPRAKPSPKQWINQTQAPYVHACISQANIFRKGPRAH